MPPRKRTALLGVSLGALIGFTPADFQGFIYPASIDAPADEGGCKTRPRQEHTPSSANSWVEIADSENEGSAGESGEAGEAGEDGGGPLAAFAPEARIAFGLMMIRAHLHAALTLMEAQPEVAGSPHLHHPLAELFPQFSADLAPEAARQLKASLEAPVDALSGPDPRNQSLARAGETLNGVTAFLEKSLWWKTAGAGDIHQAILILVAKATEEYGKGVGEGKIADAEEYQDAIGLVGEARRIFADRKGVLAAKDSDAAETLGAVFDDLPAEDFTLPEQAPVSSNAMLAALSKIELLAGRFH